jgi:hypothetical protein
MIICMISQEKQQIRMDSLSIEKRIEERSVASFVVSDNGGEYDFRQGEPVEIFIEDDELFFSGVVASSEKKIIRVFPEVYAEHVVNCIDYHYAADKRLAAKTYVEADIRDIVQDLFDSYLKDESIEIGQIDTGVMIREEIFNYVPLSQALNKLAERAGFWWLIDENKKFYFIKKNAFPYSKIVDSKTAIKGTIRLTTDNSKYRNKQIIKGTRDLTSVQTEIFKGDGVQTTFVVGYPVAKIPMVEVSNNGTTWTPSTIGIRGLEENRDWYWSGGDNAITQDQNRTPLQENQYLRVKYQGEFPQLIIADDQSEVLSQKNIEMSGSGIVEDVQTEVQQSTRAAAIQLAAQLLQYYGTVGRSISFTTMHSGFAPGQLINVDLEGYISSEMLVESIHMQTQNDIPFFTIKAMEGPNTKSWADMFQELFKATQLRERENVNIGESLIKPYVFTKQWNITENPNIFKSIYPLGQNPSESLYPSFSQEHRVRYLEWETSDGTKERKSITQLIDGENLLSVTFIAPGDAANKDIMEFSWYGGIDCKSQLNSGILIDNKTITSSGAQSPWHKTDLESWQIEKIDKRW